MQTVSLWNWVIAGLGGVTGLLEQLSREGAYLEPASREVLLKWLARLEFLGSTLKGQSAPAQSLDQPDQTRPPDGAETITSEPSAPG